MRSAAAAPRVLMLIPSVQKRDVESAVAADAHPLMDYHALQAELGADILDYADLDSAGNSALVKLAQRFGQDVALAAAGFARRADYDVIFSNGENVSLPLAALLRTRQNRPLHVLIGHRLSTGKKRAPFRALHSQMDAIFVYATTQLE